MAGLVFRLLPYDRDSVIRAMEARASEPRPHTRELDSLFQRFRGPFGGLLRAAHDEERWAARRDSLRARQGPGAPLALADSVRAVEESLAALVPRLARARTEMERARAELLPPMVALRRGVRAWESTAYRGYDSIVRRLTRDRLANPVADTTGADGWAVFPLPKGRWWINARAVDLRDPNAEWYWNLELKQDTVLLNPLTGRNRPRY